MLDYSELTEITQHFSSITEDTNQNESETERDIKVRVKDYILTFRSVKRR